MTNNGFWKNREIFPTITTTKGSNWREKIEEIKKLDLKEVCVFPTCLGLEERKELYKLLEGTGIEMVPIVHLKQDMELWEVEFFLKKYKTTVLNIHAKKEDKLLHDDINKYRKIIYIENSYKCPLDGEEIKNFAGICLDFSHLRNGEITKTEVYENDINIIKKYRCGCNHVSAILESPDPDGDYGSHYLNNLSELDYLKHYPANYFSNIIAIELENSIKEQLKAKDYIINLLKDK